MIAMKNRNAAVGEPFVWLTSMGLSLGLLMVLALLSLIVVNGFEVFWPDRVAQIKLKPGSEARISDSAYIGGRIIQVQKKAAQTNQKEDPTEWQLFVGNKDVYGYAFKFVDKKDIDEVTYPLSIMALERIEYGDAIVYPISLELEGGKSIPASDPGFHPTLNGLIKEASDRWEEIRDIEKREIGHINSRMEKLQIRRRAAGPSDRIDADLAELQKNYDSLAKRASDLRILQDKGSFQYKLFSGETKHLPIAQIMNVYWPNAMNVFQRSRFFVYQFWNFLTDEPREANTEGGIFPAIFGTFVMTLLLSIAVTPFGVLAAIYLREYAKQGLFVRSVRIAVNNLAGVPSIVFGVFGLGFFVYFMGGTIDRIFFGEYLPAPTFGTGGILWASLTLALMTVPVVIVATEEALAAVPRGVREGSLACGASKWQTIQRVVLPASSTGILTGLILAMARGAGEVAPLMLVGVVKLAPSLPLDGSYPFLHLDQKFMHLGFHIFDLGFQSPDSEAARPMVFATTFLLILLVVLLNLGAILIRERLRKKYATAAF
jgi:phosphate transport system permease protein